MIFDRLLKFQFIFLALYLFSNNIHSSTFQVVTESIPPYQQLEQGKVTGSVTDIVKNTLKCARLDSDFMLLPWKRAYDTAINNKNTLIYSMARTAERESKFFWIGPLLQSSVNLYKLKSRTDIQITNFDEIKHYKLGLLRGGFIVNLFTNKGFKVEQHFSLNDSNESRLHMLFAGRYDLIDTLDIHLAELLNKTPYSRSDLEIVMPLASNETLYLAINKTANIELVATLKKCLSQFKPIVSE
jgi:polar amino acid transport system substrate-binding protein